mmetsp:Transcript_7045/g.15798  ORF Transcript_7045/g.15798 Transcript_7045/m.15798 type:complete len:284 (-) Transcript_7045:540-1391(-)
MASHALRWYRTHISSNYSELYAAQDLPTSTGSAHISPSRLLIACLRASSASSSIGLNSKRPVEEVGFIPFADAFPLECPSHDPSSEYSGEGCSSEGSGLLTLPFLAFLAAALSVRRACSAFSSSSSLSPMMLSSSARGTTSLPPLAFFPFSFFPFLAPLAPPPLAPPSPEAVVVGVLGSSPTGIPRRGKTIDCSPAGTTPFRKARRCLKMPSTRSTRKTTRTPTSTVVPDTSGMPVSGISSSTGTYTACCVAGRGATPPAAPPPGLPATAPVPPPAPPPGLPA